MAFPDAWEEVALVSVELLGSSTEVQFMATTETIDISEPDYPGEGIATTSGGRIWKQSPQEDGEITLELYPIELDTTSGVGLFQQFVGSDPDSAGTYDTSEPLTTAGHSGYSYNAGVMFPREKFRVCILWTNDPAETIANADTAANTEALKFTAMGCRIVSHKTSFADGIVKTTATFKFPAMNKAGTLKMFRWDSGDDTALVALTAYDADTWT